MSVMYKESIRLFEHYKLDKNNFDKVDDNKNYDVKFEDDFVRLIFDKRKKAKVFFGEIDPHTTPGYFRREVWVDKDSFEILDREEGWTYAEAGPNRYISDNKIGKWGKGQTISMQKQILDTDDTIHFIDKENGEKGRYVLDLRKKNLRIPTIDFSRTLTTVDNGYKAIVLEGYRLARGSDEEDRFVMRMDNDMYELFANNGRWRVNRGTNFIVHRSRKPGEPKSRYSNKQTYNLAREICRSNKVRFKNGDSLDFRRENLIDLNKSNLMKNSTESTLEDF